MSILSEESQTKIKQLLIEQKLISAQDLEKAQKESVEQKLPILTLLVKDGKVTTEQLTKLTSEVLGLPYVNLVASKISP